MGATDDAMTVLRRALGERCAETQARLADLEALERRIVEASADSNADDEHDPEGSTIAWDRAQTAALAAEARSSLLDLDRALARVDDGWDGRCAGCGRPIDPARLEARPAADRCVTCAAAPR